MERSLRTAARQLRDAFDGEVARAATSLRLGSITIHESAWSSYADRYAAWASTARYPGLLRNVFLVDENAGGLQLRRWNQTAGALEPVAWSHSFQAWRPRFEQAMTAWRASGETPEHVILADDPSLLISPIVGTADGQTRSPRTRPDMLGFTVIELDWAFLRSRLLPELVDRFTVDDVTYLASVDDGAQPPAILYSSQPGISLDARGFEVQLLHPELRDPLSLYPPLMLRVQYRSGSIAAPVADVRRRNLAVSGGILLLLTFSVGLLALTSRRAQRLARQQMEFVAGVSHELRTPVAVIQSAAENLSHGVVDSGDRVRQYRHDGGKGGAPTRRNDRTCATARGYCIPAWTFYQCPRGPGRDHRFCRRSRGAVARGRARGTHDSAEPSSRAWRPDGLALRPPQADHERREIRRPDRLGGHSDEGRIRVRPARRSPDSGRRPRSRHRQGRSPSYLRAVLSGCQRHWAAGAWERRGLITRTLDRSRSRRPRDRVHAPWCR